jgi:hypothetical protein
VDVLPIDLDLDLVPLVATIIATASTPIVMNVVKVLAQEAANTDADALDLHPVLLVAYNRLSVDSSAIDHLLVAETTKTLRLL